MKDIDRREKPVDAIGHASSKSSGRIIALDIGTVRIGVAASDPLGTFAQGVAVLQAAGEWMDELSAIVEEYGARTIVVGMPRRTDGTDGPEAGRARNIMESLSERFEGVGVISWDERFTTAIATRALIEADVSRKGRKAQVDKVAAVLILQNYLDSQRASRPPADVPTAFPDMAGGARDGGRRKRKSAYD
ncbi:MAG: Holliday junction resolvase RuvX [Synergistaceae bacterium]|nr:Holliday junction resolvase RuvX [Synergistaceae bacterium]